MDSVSLSLCVYEIWKWNKIPTNVEMFLRIDCIASCVLFYFFGPWLWFVLYVFTLYQHNDDDINARLMKLTTFHFGIFALGFKQISRSLTRDSFAYFIFLSTKIILSVYGLCDSNRLFRIILNLNQSNNNMVKLNANT